MTTNKDDYLKAIYHCGGLGKRVSTKAIAQKLGIASASVTEMVARLAKEGLLTYEPYKGSQLTQTGAEACINVVRSHELWEVFLVQYLGYSLSEAHSDAEALEHATSLKLAERLETLLNRPEVCPHGAVIPRPGNIPPERDMLLLSALNAGNGAVIGQTGEEKELLDYLERLGIKTGTHIILERFGEYGGPLEVTIGSQVIQLTRKAADQIWVLADTIEDGHRSQR